MWWNTTGWLWWWFLFVLVFFLLPLGYGWGYRGWGPWYRRRSSQPSVDRTSAGPDLEEGWGWIGSLMWVVLLIAIIWVVAAVLWRPA